MGSYFFFFFFLMCGCSGNCVCYNYPRIRAQWRRYGNHVHYKLREFMSFQSFSLEKKMLAWVINNLQNKVNHWWHYQRLLLRGKKHWNFKGNWTYNVGFIKWDWDVPNQTLSQTFFSLILISWQRSTSPVKHCSLESCILLSYISFS